LVLARPVSPAPRFRFASLRGRPLGGPRASVPLSKEVPSPGAPRVPAGASALADLAGSALELERPVAVDLATAEDARKLTLDRMEVTLRALDLARAAILLNGPRDPVTRAFAAIGRSPRVVTP
jgi:hypothetical protein